MTSASTTTRIPLVTFRPNWPVIRGFASVLLLLFVPIFVEAIPVGRVTARAAGPGWQLEHEAVLAREAYRAGGASESGDPPSDVYRSFEWLINANSVRSENQPGWGLILFAGVFLAGMRRYGALIGAVVSSAALMRALQGPAAITERYASLDWPGSLRLEFTDGVAIGIAAYVGLLLWHVVRYFLDRRAAEVSEATS